MSSFTATCARQIVHHQEEYKHTVPVYLAPYCTRYYITGIGIPYPTREHVRSYIGNFFLCFRTYLFVRAVLVKTPKGVDATRTVRSLSSRFGRDPCRVAGARGKPSKFFYPRRSIRNDCSQGAPPTHPAASPAAAPDASKAALSDDLVEHDFFRVDDVKIVAFHKVSRLHRPLKAEPKLRLRSRHETVGARQGCERYPVAALREISGGSTAGTRRTL